MAHKYKWPNIDAKRIVCTLTIESDASNRLTYEKELLNSRENSHLHKTNHPDFLHALLP